MFNSEFVGMLTVH